MGLGRVLGWYKGRKARTSSLVPTKRGLQEMSPPSHPKQVCEANSAQPHPCAARATDLRRVVSQCTVER